MSQTNKQEYATLMAEWVVNKHIEKQFNAFKKGFHRVVTGDIIRVRLILLSYFQQKNLRQLSVDPMRLILLI